MNILEVTNLKASAEGKEILRGVTLQVAVGEALVLMGPNGSGKSTLAHVLMGHPGYQVTEGYVTYQGQDLLSLKPEERAGQGLFLSFQYPQTIAGVTIGNFLRLAYNSTHAKKLGVKEFVVRLKEKMEQLSIPLEFMQRSVNEGMSGGEKKRLEMLQMLMLEPKLAILDETDSGLDVDALKIVAHAAVATRAARPDFSLLVITHYQRLLDYLPVERVAVMRQGKVITEGSVDLLQTIEREGYAKM
jgi:Fe-S cluster assembly ATP-binding protein